MYACTHYLINFVEFVFSAKSATRISVCIPLSKQIWFP